MKKYVLCIILLLISLTSIAIADDYECYTKVKFYEEKSGEWEDLGAMSSGNCADGAPHNGIYYIGKKQTGISGGIVNEADDVIFEAPFTLRVIQLTGGKVLFGVIYGMNFLDDSKISTGNKLLIDQPIEFDKEAIIPFAKRTNGNRIAIGVTVLSQRIKSKTSDAPISLRTAMFANGENAGSVTNNKWALTEITNFSTGTGLKTDSTNEHLTYKVQIKIPEMPKEITAPFQTTLTLNRLYQITADFYSRKKLKVAVQFTSSYEKKIELIPGKTLVLVFPPDSPSVRGFDMVDTLILKP